MKNQINIHRVVRWFLSIAALVFLALTGTVARATPYASCVTNNDGTIQFYLNESNADVIVTYNDGSTNANFNGITTGTNLSSGFYSFSLGTYTNYAIWVYKTGAGFPNVIQTLSEPGATVNPRGIDVNRIPTSPYFGAVYWVNGGGSPPGIFLLNSDLSSMSSANPLTGGVTTFGSSGTGTGQSPDFISVAPDGFVLVADASTNGSAIYRIDPGLATSQLLLGPVGDYPATAEGIHGTIESPPIVTGSLSSSNLVLYDIDGELAPYNSIQVYDIGAGPLPWTSPPTYTGYEVGIAGYDSIVLGGNEYCGLSMGTNGYIYASTYRNNFSNPVLQIYDSTGRTNLWNSWGPAGTVYPGGTATGDFFAPTNAGLSSGLVGSQVSADGQYVAGVNVYNTLIVCPLTNGIPNLAGMLSITNPLGTTANCRGIAWDSADNLYMSSSGLGTLQEWSLGYTTVAVTTGNTNGVTGFRVGYPPYFRPSAPTNASAYTGTTLTLPVTVFGTPPLGYQLYDVNGGTNVATGSTNETPLNTTLTFSNVPTAWNGDQLELIVTNVYGTTNIYIALDILTNPPLVITAAPVTYTNLFTLYAGANPAFSISAAGPSLSYYWYTNGVLDGAISAASSNMMWTNVQVGFITNDCVISNYLGVTTNVWTAQVIADPTNSAGGLAPYPQSVLALNPIGYWRLNDTNLDGVDNGGPDGNGNNGNGDVGWIANDYAGGNDGIYTNVSLGNVGYNPTADPSDTSAQFGETDLSFSDSDVNSIAGINFGSPAGTSVAFTIEAWVSGYPGSSSSDEGIVTLGWGGGGEQFCMDVYDDHFRFFFRPASGTTSPGVTSSVVPSTVGLGPWYHLVGVVDEITNHSVTFYINGQSVGSASVASGSGVLSSSYLMGIGARMSTQNTNFNDQFLGNINDVAIFNYALSSNQVLNEYAGSGIAPYFIQSPPASEIVDAGSTLTIPATVMGTPILGYQWQENGSAIAGASATTNGILLNAGLVYSNVPGSWNNGTLTLIVTNAYGATNIPISLSVLTSPVITNNISSQITLVQGQSYVYSIGASGAVPLIYQWLTNNVPDTTAGTNATYALTNVQPGMSGETYECIVTNSLSSANSVISTLTVIPAPTNTYAAAMLGMHPVAYWPMHEVEPWVPGDIETNYGTLGLLGTGYYPDWMANNVGCISHGFPGAIAGDSDTAVFFNMNLIANQGGAYTNALYIPHSSPLATLNPPFSVECWIFEETNGSETNTIWSQNGNEGLNAGSYNGGYGTNGIGPRGIRLGWNAIGPSGANIPGFTLYTYDDTPSDSTTVNTLCSMTNAPTAINTDTWYHVVVTCDANTNFIIYTNGYAAVSNAGVGLYSPDYWNPLTIGSGKGFSQAEPCAIDEFAVYTNALTPAAILSHYQTGINSSPATSYFNTILGANPLIYYRMDSPTYNAPPASTWPLLLNYGSVQTLGGIPTAVYTPGTLPGILPGPNHNGVPWPGFSGSSVAAMSGVSSFADVGYTGAYNPTGSNAFSVCVTFRANPADNRYQTIVGHSDNNWRIALGANNAGGGAPGSVQLGFGGLTQQNASVTCNDGNWHQAVGVYQPGDSPAIPGTVSLYVDGQLSTFSTGQTNIGPQPGTNLDVLLGADPEYTNNSPGVGRQFDGQLCDVALFTNALTATQVRNLYNASGAQPLQAPAILRQLPITYTNLVTLYAGVSPSFAITATNTPQYYQWYTNGMAVGFGTNATLTLPNVGIGFLTNYCIISNSVGSITSEVWTAQVILDPDPDNSFSQQVISDNPVAYWRLNESAHPPGAIANDYAGGASALYGPNTTNGLPGAPLSGVSGELGVAMDTNVSVELNGVVTNAGIILNTNVMTFVSWIYSYKTQANPVGLFFNRTTAGDSGADIGGANDFDYTWNDSSTTYDYGSGLAVPNNNWAMTVLEITPTSAEFYVFATNGAAGPAVQTTPLTMETFTGGNIIGGDPNGNDPGRIFCGEMDEVAIFNYQLSSNQLRQLYNAGTFVTTSPSPALQFAKTPTNLTLSWPNSYGVNYTGWILQAQTNRITVGISTNWVNVSGSISTNQVIIPINLTNGSVFYRLIYAP